MQYRPIVLTGALFTEYGSDFFCHFDERSEEKSINISVIFRVNHGDFSLRSK